jgi:hypothetical protein
MVCLRNICINTLQKGAKNDDDNDDDDDNNNNNNNNGSPVYPMKTHRPSRGTVPLILNLALRRRQL